MTGHTNTPDTPTTHRGKLYIVLGVYLMAFVAFAVLLFSWDGNEPSTTVWETETKTETQTTPPPTLPPTLPPTPPSTRIALSG